MPTNRLLSTGLCYKGNGAVTILHQVCNGWTYTMNVHLYLGVMAGEDISTEEQIQSMYDESS